jgi:MFS family permease
VNTAPDTQEASGMPAGIRNAYVFSVFNTMSFSLVNGVTTLLYLKNLGASATVLSLLGTLVHLLNLFQIPAANYVEKVGYRKFVLRGWTSRAFFVLFMAGVTLLPSGIDAPTRICLLLFFLFGYNTLRGISACGFLPWMTQLVPESVRGRYISNDQMCVHGTIIFMNAATAVYFAWSGETAHFAPVFLFSFVAAAVSIVYLKRIPDVPTQVQADNPQPVPWKAIITYRPFFLFLIFLVITHTAFAAGGIYYLPFLRDYHGVSDSKFLVMNVIAGLMSLAALSVFGKMVDRVGSRPILVTAVVLMGLHFSGWLALAAGLVPFSWGLVIFQQTTAGLAGSMFGMANVRYVMGIVPAMGRSHFFAVYTVVISLTMGLVPLFWGPLIDSLGGWSATMGPWTWNAYSILYTVLALTFVVALVYMRKIEEPKSMTTDEFMTELLISSPARAISRLWTRRPGHPS